MKAAQILAFISGSVLSTSAGRLKHFVMFGPGAPLVIFPSEKITWRSTGPGMRQRVPRYHAKYDYDLASRSFHSEVRAISGNDILATNLKPSRIDASTQLREDVCRWIPTQELAKRIAQRQVDTLGAGMLVWRFTSTEPHPELEFGDVVAAQTDRFFARDPTQTSQRTLKGALWVLARVVEHDMEGREFGVWIQSYADIFGSSSDGTLDPLIEPDLFELVLNVSQTGAVTLTTKSEGAHSVKFAVSTSSEPSAATVRAASAQTVDADGVFRSSTIVTLTAGQTAYVAAFAYSTPAIYSLGSLGESKLVAGKITHYEGGVSADGFESARSAYTISFTITARDSDGEQVKLHYRSVTAISDSYVTPTPTSTSLNNQPYTPAAVVVDRGLVDRVFEWWAEDASGNKSSIQRFAMPAIASADQEAAITSFAGNGGSFVGTCPTRSIDDVLSWTKAGAVPSGWTVNLFRCQTQSCTPPTTGPFVTTTAGGSPQTSVGPVGMTNTAPDSTFYRTYRLRLENAYGDVVDDDVTIEYTTFKNACP